MTECDLILDAFVRIIHRHGWAVTAAVPGRSGPRHPTHVTAKVVLCASGRNPHAPHLLHR